ncbi:MoaD/ThiS family protein [Natrarchaeobius chitinivorans]|uniref:Pterin cluster protein n=1 Tax=Natrarchaeobius chitinivorans TaxID=1679083 RepID=A0A3N6LTL2_NATCH|nr:MoaD/ThiS family protein [Natrarchaeobius chitinivorans]RQG90784.1 pterin cluster protein [Natrarchaeobius chitinivorans]
MSADAPRLENEHSEGDRSEVDRTRSEVDWSERDRTERVETVVTVRCTGHVREAVGTHELEFEFPGKTLREFLDAFFEEYDVSKLLIAETEVEATARGWAPVPEDLPGTWRKNPEGEQTRPYARVCINGRFNEHFQGFDTELEDGDRVALVNPFMFCV